MITLLTGSPGGGKSLYAVSKIIPDLLRDGRRIYTNLVGLNYEGVNKDGTKKNLVPTKDDIPVSELIFPLPDSNDWRETPKGSVIIYDEAQQFFPASGRSGLSNDGRITDLDTHRHNGYDIIFITQHPTLISSHIRKFVGLHYHLYRKWGGTYSSLYIWNHCNSSPESEIGEEQRADKRLFKFPKKAYNFYKSSEIHTHKFRIPKKFFYVVGGLSLMFAIIGFLGWVSFTNITKVYRGEHLSTTHKEQLNRFIYKADSAPRTPPKPEDRPNFRDIFHRDVVD